MFLLDVGVWEWSSIMAGEGMACKSGTAGDGEAWLFDKTRCR
jgi:hypothetical protein